MVSLGWGQKSDEKKLKNIQEIETSSLEFSRRVWVKIMSKKLDKHV